MAKKQKTLCSAIKATGYGRLKQKRIHMQLCPAAENSGIIFRRMDLPGQPEIKANLDNAINCRHGVTLQKGLVAVSAATPLLATLYALGIDNVVVELQGAEIPIIGDSLDAYVFLIKAAGIRELSQNKLCFSQRRPIQVFDGQAWLRLLPGKQLALGSASNALNIGSSRPDYLIHFSDALFSSQICHTRLSQNHFAINLNSVNAHQQSRQQQAGQFYLLLAELALVGAECQGVLLANQADKHMLRRLLRILVREQQNQRQSHSVTRTLRPVFPLGVASTA
ncbi:MAG: UDP-3-O-acyl-N-acetylglucosamine deacetylase [Gammaproteobacteria bacterium]|nr:UDP-3-O-acyl-N-acetylglucosamine deacetylase [Gammaproteobacteria bacterium]